MKWLLSTIAKSIWCHVTFWLLLFDVWFRMVSATFCRTHFVCTILRLNFSRPNKVVHFGRIKFWFSFYFINCLTVGKNMLSERMGAHSSGEGEASDFALRSYWHIRFYSLGSWNTFLLGFLIWKSYSLYGLSSFFVTTWFLRKINVVSSVQ